MALQQVWRDTIRADARRLRRALDQAPDAAVVACPGWDVAALAGHVGQAHRFWTRVVVDRAMDAEEAAAIEDAEVPDRAALGAWFDEGVDALLDALERAPLDRGAWNWSRGPQVVGWILRRSAHELAVHRWDAEHAARGGAAKPVQPAALAVDGIHEVLTVFLGAQDPSWEGADAWVQLVPTDAERFFDLRLLPPRVHLSDGRERDPDLVVTAPASDLLLWLWRRPTEVTLVGEAALAGPLQDYLDLD